MGHAGIINGSTPAMLIRAAQRSNHWAARAATVAMPGMVPIALCLDRMEQWAVTVDGGRHARQYLRGMDAAPLAEEIAMLPLDLIGVGEALAPIRQRASKVARSVAERAVGLSSRGLSKVAPIVRPVRVVSQRDG